MSQRRASAMILTAAMVLALTACSAESPKKENKGPAPVVRIAPGADATRIPVTAEISTSVENGTIEAITLSRTGGTPTPGAMRIDGSAWVPAAPLAYNQSYTVAVRVRGANGEETTARTTFRTVPGPTGSPMSASMNLASGETYGVGMPIVIDFSADIPVNQRAAVQRRLFVRSDPPQIGGWRWYSASEVMYRPRDYWKPDTKLQVRAALGGLEIGGRYIAKDRTANVTIGRDMRFAVTNSNHELTVTQDGKVVKRFPISMGKPSTPSWSGHFVIMERDYYVVFDTLDQPGGYRVPVNYAERITWSGTFIHSAPWSVWAQGSRNVSHGCVNVAPGNAAWIFRNSKVGDPVSISGTPIHAAPGNGWTVWDMSWTDYIKGTPAPPDSPPMTPRPMPTA